MEKTRPATRVRVMAANMSREIGLGTYLGEDHWHGMIVPRIVLDSGQQIFGPECWWWSDPDAPPLTPFTYTMTRGTRVFERDGDCLRKDRYRLDKNDQITVVGFEALPYDHGLLPFVSFTYKDLNELLLAREVNFLPYLEAVAAQAAAART